MVTRFPLIAAPIVELNIQLMKILVLKLFLRVRKLPSQQFHDTHFRLFTRGRVF